MKTIVVWFLNFILGVAGTAVLLTKLTGRGEGVAATSKSASVNIDLDMTGLVVWIAVMAVYFFGAKKLWGKTVGAVLVDSLGGKKKKKK